MAGCSVGRWKDGARHFLAGCFVGRWKDGAAAIFLTGSSVGRWKDGAPANFASGCFAGRWKDGVVADFWARCGRSEIKTKEKACEEDAKKQNKATKSVEKTCPEGHVCVILGVLGASAAHLGKRVKKGTKKACPEHPILGAVFGHVGEKVRSEK